MKEHLIRVYKKFDLNAVKGQLLVYGDISGTCANCQTIDLKLNDPVCPQCKAEFKYVAFRNVRSHLPKIQKIAAERPSVQIIDYEDYHHHMGAQKARDFLK